MEAAIWLVLIATLFAFAVFGGFWVIRKAALPQMVTIVFAVLVLIILVFALVWLVRGGWSWPYSPPPPVRVTH